MNFIKLLPNEVPGATLKIDLIEDHTVRKLKRWLECRGWQPTGRKEDLIERIQNCITNGRKNEIVAGVDNGKWCDRKCADANQA
ncbi:hypothetical protein FQA39_LY11923 [Lamprigera yunnana]|nr:hypothetical protein FQA39_LY11923 [Lamprigera yunnana]